MSVLAKQIEGYLDRASWIRRMFETGIEMKARFGADNVFDFSLGNPDLPPPPGVADALAALATTASSPLCFGYCPNAGLPEARKSLAETLSDEQQTILKAANVMFTCGAAGGLNTVFRSVLEAGDEVVCPAPYFVEYGFYAENHGGRLVPVPTAPLTFQIDLDALDRAITERTRILLINSPNNPTGRTYSHDELQAVADLLASKSDQFGRPIYLVSDEPYRFLCYDGTVVPPILPLYEHAIVVGSYSKSLSLAGERIGYIALNPAAPDTDKLMAGLVLANRILGFVNAPIIGQRIVTALPGTGVDITVYDARRRAMAAILDEAHIDYTMPTGAFYFFPRVPEHYDELAFIERLRTEKILAVPGRGFGTPGYFRLTFCMDEAIIQKSREAFLRAVERA